MISRLIVALALAACFCVSSVLAEPRILRQDAPLPAPEAADQTNGMAIMAALVQGDGTLSSGAGVVSAQKLGTGSYSVTFNRPIDFANCFFMSKPIGTAGFVNTSIIVFPSDLRVSTLNLTGASADLGFTVMVFCPR